MTTISNNYYLAKREILIIEEFCYMMGSPFYGLYAVAEPGLF